MGGTASFKECLRIRVSFTFISVVYLQSAQKVRENRRNDGFSGSSLKKERYRVTLSTTTIKK